MKNLFRFLKLKNSYQIAYFTIGLLFIIWILFLDSHSWLTHRELNQEIEQLENRKRELRESIKKDKRIIEQLQDEDSLEHFARETFGHKKENETLFIIKNED